MSDKNFMAYGDAESVVTGIANKIKNNTNVKGIDLGAINNTAYDTIKKCIKRACELSAPYVNRENDFIAISFSWSGSAFFGFIYCYLKRNEQWGYSPLIEKCSGGAIYTGYYQYNAEQYYENTATVLS